MDEQKENLKSVSYQDVALISNLCTPDLKDFREFILSAIDNPRLLEDGLGVAELELERREQEQIEEECKQEEKIIELSDEEMDKMQSLDNKSLFILVEFCKKVEQEPLLFEEIDKFAENEITWREGY